MVELITDDIIFAPRDTRHHTEVYLKAGGVDHHILLAHPLGQLVLELQVKVDGAVEKTRACTSRTVLAGGLDGGGHHPRMVGEPQVGVGSEHQHPTAVHHDLGVLFALYTAEVGVYAPCLDLLWQVVACHTFA